jgi:hypothetical protein
MIGKSHRLALCHRDRWRVEDMVAEQPDLLRKDPERDMDLWRHLFAPGDLVRVGGVCRAASEAVAAEWYSGNTWSGKVVVATVAVCWPAMALLRGATCKERMSRAQTCEAVLGRLRAARVEVVLVVEDGAGGLDCWVDPFPVGYRMQSRGRCPGGINSRTGERHRVVWVHPVTRIAWEDDDWSVWEAAKNGSQ